CCPRSGPRVRSRMRPPLGSWRWRRGGLTCTRRSR
ncbi:MAG: hypothetical protein AVDCRST_MAG36-2869, partial [uncultured Nocardioidaceae bacterium]